MEKSPEKWKLHSRCMNGLQGQLEITPYGSSNQSPKSAGMLQAQGMGKVQAACNRQGFWRNTQKEAL